MTKRPASFRLLLQGARPTTFAALPLLVFAAPFIIMRNTIRGTHIEGRGFSMVMVATIIAGGWSLMSGTVVVMALTAFGVPVVLTRARQAVGVVASSRPLMRRA